MLIEFDQVSYSYPCSHYPALLNLNLGIKQHQRCVIIGRNGCGKSTLFCLANGLYRPNRGIIRFLGKPLNYQQIALQKLRQKVGLVFQNPEQQLVAPTVAADISYGLCNLELPETEIASRVQQTLAEFSLEDLAYTPIHYLSLGQKKRVSLANVMILEPELLLLDEPTAYLDSAQIRNLLLLLRKIEQKGTTIVIATHDLNLAYVWADWIIVMDQGSVILEGTPQAVFNNHQVLENIGLGVPLVINLLETIKQFIDSNGGISQHDLTLLTETLYREAKSV
ncbi:MAG: ABC transporter ATP-binding protein [Gloeocapsa sp. DLM2.Bin57]|nr:MAG: ABC transporter ATP-binding protein [Gloeocapsa sp. DLM2.Bin57]